MPQIAVFTPHGRIKLGPKRRNWDIIYQFSIFYLPVIEVDASANSLRALANFVNSVAEKGVDGLRKEYQRIDRTFDGKVTCETFKMNMDKNRYSDVLCWDESRVKLWYGSNEFGDYIHANRVTAPVLRTGYICTQGPTKDTIHDFWRMVFQERVENIVMLCNPVEEGKIKCAMYWPEQEGVVTSLQFPTLTITNHGMESENEFTITTLTVVPNLEHPCTMALSDSQKAPLEVKLLRWASWPDRGIPSRECLTILPIILLDKVRSKRTVIHCSAGIGRTGCLVALEIAHEKIAHGLKVDFLEIVQSLRVQRAQCIQTEIQYLYINRVMVEYAYRHANLEPLAYQNGKKFIEEYEKKLKG